MLAFTGRFDADTLRQTLRSSEPDEDAEEDGRVAEHCQRRRCLLHAKAEARARYNEGERLAKHRDAHGEASQPARESSSSEATGKVLERWDSGELLRDLKRAVAAWEHGRLHSADGEHLDIGGSSPVGGGSRRLIEGWVPPNWREFLSDSETA